MEKWEYKVVDIPGDIRTKETRLNELGQQGWELVCCNGNYYIFKRKVIQ